MVRTSGPDARSASCAGMEWRVIRRLDGRLQGDYRTLFRGAGDRRRRPARVPARRRPAARRLERDRADGHPVRARVPRGPRGHGLAAARLLAVDGLRTGRAAQARRADRGRRHRGAAAGPRRQPDRRAALRHRGRGDDPARPRPQPGAAHPLAADADADGRAVTSRPGRGPRPRHGPPTSPWRCAPRSASPGGGRWSWSSRTSSPSPGWERPLAHARPPARRGGHPGARPARVRAPGRRDDLRRGRRDRRADLRRHQRRRRSSSGCAPRPTSGRPR